MDISIFLIISLQFSSLVSADISYGSGYGLTQISTSKTINNGVLSTIIRTGYFSEKRDHKVKDHNSHSDENSEEMTSKGTSEVTTEKTTEPKIHFYL